VTAHGGSSGGRGSPGGGAEARDRRGGPGGGACARPLARVGEPLPRSGGGAPRSGLQRRRKGQRRRARAHRRGGGGDTPGRDRAARSPARGAEQARAAGSSPAAPLPAGWPWRPSVCPSSLSACSSLSCSRARRPSSGRPPTSMVDSGERRVAGHHIGRGGASATRWSSSTTSDAGRALPQPLPCSLSPAATAGALSRQGRELVGAVHRVVWWALADPSGSP
jgi:hypothetical protein